MSIDRFIPLGNTSFTGCGYVIVSGGGGGGGSSSSSSSSTKATHNHTSLRCVSITYPFWPLPSPSPVLATGTSPSCCVAGAKSVWAFVSAAGLGMPMVKVPPFVFNEVDDDDDENDFQMLNGGGFAWAHSIARSATRICTVSFHPPPLLPSSASSAHLPPSSLYEEYIVSSTVSWRKTQDSR